jgi:hypothetical protein
MLKSAFLIISLGLAQTCFAANPVAQQSTVVATRAPATSAPRAAIPQSKDMSEELKIMGQSRNLSMGLLFQKDKDKLSFGTPRTNYKDKISDSKSNF